MATSRASLPAAPAAPFRLSNVLVPLVAIIIGIFMVVLDGTAVNVALPKLVADFHTTLPTLQWIVTGYTLAQAAVIPLAGWLSDRYGAKPVFLTSVALFTIGSVLCATAQSSDDADYLPRLAGAGRRLRAAGGDGLRLSPQPARQGGRRDGHDGYPHPVRAGHRPRAGRLAGAVRVVALDLPAQPAGGHHRPDRRYRRLPAVQRQAVAALDRLGAMLGPLAFAALSYGVSQGSTSWTSTQHHRRPGRRRRGPAGLHRGRAARRRTRCWNCASSGRSTSAWPSWRSGSASSRSSGRSSWSRSSCSRCAASAPSILVWPSCRRRSRRRVFMPHRRHALRPHRRAPIGDGRPGPRGRGHVSAGAGRRATPRRPI